MAESKELQELRRLLRAGFRLQRIVAKTGQSEAAPESGIEITKTVDGSTAQIQYRNEWISNAQPGEPMTVTFPDEGRSVEASLVKESVERVLRSSDKDFWDFTLAMHPSLDANGNPMLRRFRDTGRQIDESKWLATLILDDEQRKEYLQRSVNESGGKLDFKLKTLLLEYLKTAAWGAPKFLPLKKKFFELQLVLLNETKGLLASRKKGVFRGSESPTVLGPRR